MRLVTFNFDIDDDVVGVGEDGEDDHVIRI